VLDTVHAGRQAAVAVVEPYRVDAAAAGLGDDQAEAVRRLCGDGERISVMVGPVGSGKTRTLSAARQAWQAAGVPVRVVAPSAVAAGVLTEGARIRSETLAKFLLEITDGRQTLRRGEVIICDEASMVSTRDLDRLVLLAEHADAKVVLVSDHYQLGSVDAGGMFRLLANDNKAAELTTIRRFNDPWEADATSRLRHGDTTVITEYINRGRIRSGDRDHVLDAAHQAWHDLRDEGRTVVVMAGDHDTVDQLAMRARATRVQAGQVEPGGITIGNQTVGAGDEIVTTRNNRGLVTSRGAWVRNGDRWKIASRTRNYSLVLDSLDARGKVTVPSG
jgi:ATP-dependent exoDNAse (exonuclease V) alpha subunit